MFIIKKDGTKWLKFNVKTFKIEKGKIEDFFEEDKYYEIKEEELK